jgi:hypothetical protein
MVGLVRLGVDERFIEVEEQHLYPRDNGDGNAVDWTGTRACICSGLGGGSNEN